MRIGSAKLALGLSALILIATRFGTFPANAASNGDRDWPAYGGGSEGTRYSPLGQINQSNVSKLQLAWIFDTADGPGDTQTQPIMIDGVLFGVTPTHKIIALDAASGNLIWKFDSGLQGRGPNRSVTYWASGSERRLFAGVQSYVYALDPVTGKPLPEFGDKGRIDLREGLGRDPQQQSIVLTSPGIIYRDVLIVGGRTPEALPAPPGDVRAFDVRTGKVRWTFHTIPHPGEFGSETWPPDARQRSGSANNWAGMALDEKRGIVYIPTGSAASDFYGADRLGDNLFANSLLALNAATGERIWHFQAVKHDLWDRDFPSPPVLVTVLRDGKSIDAVAQATKHGWIYVLDRATGKSLFPVQYKSYPSSSIPGEIPAPTQPLPTLPAPFARQRLTEDLLTNRTPAAHAWALERFRTLRSEGQFVPLSVNKDTVIFPGFDGGAEWGGQAFDPVTGLLYVNSNDLAWTGALAASQGAASPQSLYLKQCASCHGDRMDGVPPQIPSLAALRGTRTVDQIGQMIRQGAGRMPSFPALSNQDVMGIAQYVLTGDSKEAAPVHEAPQAYRFTGYRKFLDPDGYPAVAPPWGTLNAINLNTGEYAWKIPFGEYPELAAQGIKATGTENYGGPVVTAGGLVFIGATNFDKKFHAFDKQTGKLLWEYTLPIAGNATPITYQRAGKQYVVIYATGSKAGRGTTSGGIYVAFSLPADK